MHSAIFYITCAASAFICLCFALWCTANGFLMLNIVIPALHGLAISWLTTAHWIYVCTISLLSQMHHSVCIVRVQTTFMVNIYLNLCKTPIWCLFERVCVHARVCILFFSFSASLQWVRCVFPLVRVFVCNTNINDILLCDMLPWFCRVLPVSKQPIGIRLAAYSIPFSVFVLHKYTQTHMNREQSHQHKDGTRNIYGLHAYIANTRPRFM